MNQAQSTQFDRIPWGTPMPVLVRSTSGMMQLRFRGVCSVSVANPALFAGKVGDAGSLPGKVRNILTGKLADVLPGMKPADLQAALDGKYEIAAGVLQTAVEADFAALGLKLNQVVIEGVEKM